jgi:AcrR family transcriptional regulator
LFIKGGGFMDNLDNRVRFTKAVLQQALLKILQTKHIDRVTIKELCQEAKVNRGTFYLHYATPNDLLMEIEQQFIDENMAQFNPYFHEGYETSYLAGLFTGVLKNKDLCRIIMGKNGNPRFIERIQQMIRPSVIDGWCAEFPTYKREDLDYIYDFVFTGSMRLILNWIEDDHGLSTAELANRLDRLGHHCHMAIPEFIGKK